MMVTTIESSSIAMTLPFVVVFVATVAGQLDDKMLIKYGNFCVVSGTVLLVRMIHSISFFLSFSTFPPKSALAFPPWKQTRSTGNFDAMCRMMVLVHILLLFSPGNLTYGQKIQPFELSRTISSRLGANAVTASPYLPGCLAAVNVPSITQTVVQFSS